MRLAPATIAVCLGLAVAGAAQAQSLEDRLRSQLVSVTAQLRETQSGQATLVAQKAAAEKDRDVLKAKLAQTSRHPPPAANSPELTEAKAQVERLTQANTDLQAQLTAARTENGRLSQGVEQAQAKEDTLSAALAANEKGLAVCKAKNADLIAVAREILATYQHTSVVGVVARKEPFIGLQRVQVERLAQDYGDRVYAGQLDVQPPAPKPPADQPKPQ